MLKAGMWIAQGPETNVLLLLSGVEPLLEVVGAIDLNYFKQNGKAKDLTKDSPEVVDIMMYPEKYTFALPSITEVVDNIGIGDLQTLEGLGEDSRKDKIIEEGIAYYKSTLPLYGIEQAKVRTRLYLKKKYSLKMSQANYVFTVICKALNREP